ncbi:MAG: SPOR domain-containing protein, partial [Nannocystaceae bacterium]
TPAALAKTALSKNPGQQDQAVADTQAPKPDTQAPKPVAAQPKPTSKLRPASLLSPEAPELAAFAQALPAKSFVWVGKLAGNGARPVLVYIPPGATVGADFQLVYHFHGTYSEHIEAKSPGVPKKRWVGTNRLQQTIEAMGELQQQQPYNVALVYPLSAGKRQDPDHKGWWNGAYDRLWMASHRAQGTDSFAKLHTEVLDILTTKFGVHPELLTRPLIAEGHSAGGLALRNVADSGTKLVGEYIFLDASFQTWADRCYTAVQSHGSKAKLTLVITDKGIADAFGKRDPWCARLETNQQLWDEHSTWCQGTPESSPQGIKQTCAELLEADTDWEEFQPWCTAMKNDMKDIEGVYVHRTKVPHGEQPRRFSGGLELPAVR